jgi:glycerophosphoryl diester phosphodiesterase
VTIAFILALALLWGSFAWRPRPLRGVTRARPLALGHRGVRGERPENTLPAFALALESGLDGLETDVQRTRDGVLVLYHDFDHRGRRITDLEWAELRADLPDLTTLDALLDVVRAYPGTLLNVELKTLGHRDNALAEAVATQLRASGLHDRLVVSSFSPLALARFRLRAPRIRTALLYFDGPAAPWWLRSPWSARWLHVDAVHPHHRSVSAAAVRRWHRRGLMVNVWTVNDPDDVRRVTQAGVDGVMADRPAALLSALGRGRAG